MNILSENVGRYKRFSGFFIIPLAIPPKQMYAATPRKDLIGKNSALYQLMGTCMNGIVNGDVEYQAFSASPDRMDLSKETFMTGFTSPFSCQEASRSATLATSLSAGQGTYFPYGHPAPHPPCLIGDKYSKSRYSLSLLVLFRRGIQFLKYRNTHS